MMTLHTDGSIECLCLPLSLSLSFRLYFFVSFSLLFAPSFSPSSSFYLFSSLRLLLLFLCLFNSLSPACFIFLPPTHILPISISLSLALPLSLSLSISLSLSLTHSFLGSVWLSHNKSLEGYEKQLIEQTECRLSLASFFPFPFHFPSHVFSVSNFSISFYCRCIPFPIFLCSPLSFSSQLFFLMRYQHS